MTKQFVRQAMFRDNGTTTDIPAKDTELKQEHQGNLFLWGKEQEVVTTKEDKRK